MAVILPSAGIMLMSMDAQYAARFLDTIRNHPPQPESSQDNRETLHLVYDAVIRGDFNAFGKFLTDDVELDIRGLASMDGNWHGRDQVVEAARANFGQVAEQKPEIESMISGDNSIAVLFRESGVLKLEGRSYRFRVVQWFTFADGKLKRIDEIVASTNQADQSRAPSPHSPAM
jgi:ketosteroid isomerase-like protein